MTLSDFIRDVKNAIIPPARPLAMTYVAPRPQPLPVQTVVVRNPGGTEATLVSSAQHTRGKSDDHTASLVGGR